MPRDILNNSIRAGVIAKFNSRCCVCSYSLLAALKVHHIIPVSFGGTDDPANFALICANCHSLVHYYSSKQFAGRDVASIVSPELDSRATVELLNLTQAIHNARASVESNLGLVSGAVTWAEAIAAVSRLNRFTQEKQLLFSTVMQQVLAHIPREVAAQSSFRLSRNKKYISINVMNYLLFRAPAYTDMGGDPLYETYFLATTESPLTKSAQAEDRGVFIFKHFEAANFGLSFSAIMEISEQGWADFASACLRALNARKSRNWVSNIISN